MGAWSRGPFDNDAASDWLARAAESPSKAVREALARAHDAGDVDVDEGSEALAAATLVAAAHDGATKGLPRGARPIVAALKATASLRASAVKAVDAVLGEDSELRALWDEGDEGEAWRADVAALRARLDGAPGGAAKSGPGRAPKAIAKPRAPKRPQPGDVFEVKLSDGRLGYCQLRIGVEYAFFAIASDRPLAIDEVASSPVAFRMHCLSDGIRTKAWRRVVNAPLSPAVAAFVPTWGGSPGWYRITEQSKEGARRATEDEIRGLERGDEIWPAAKAVERLELFLRGEPCPWVQVF